MPSRAGGDSCVVLRVGLENAFWECVEIIVCLIHIIYICVEDSVREAAWRRNGIAE